MDLTLVLGYVAVVPEFVLPFFPLFSCPWPLFLFYSSSLLPTISPVLCSSIANIQDKKNALLPCDIIKYLFLEGIVNDNKSMYRVVSVNPSPPLPSQAQFMHTLYHSIVSPICWISGKTSPCQATSTVMISGSTVIINITLL